MYLIEKNIPISQHGRAKYPLAGMEIGDSFLVPASAIASQKNHNAVRRAASVWGSRHGRTFRSHKQPDGSIRVWRTA